MKLTSLLVVLALLSPLTATADETPTRFWHLGAVVEDIEVMHQFYTEILGLVQATDLAFADSDLPATEGVTPLKGLDGLMGMKGTRTIIRHYSAPNHDLFLEFIHFPDHPAETVQREVYRPRGWSHLGLEVNSIDAVIYKMEHTGLGSLVGEPTVLPAFNNNLFLIIKDPEGNVVELFQPSPLAEEEVAQQQSPTSDSGRPH